MTRSPQTSRRASRRATNYARYGEHLFHHTRPLEHVVFGPVRSEPRADEMRPDGPCDPYDDFHDQLMFETSYRWLEERLGFWPTFLAVGDHEEARRMTGYANQFSRRIGWSAKEGPLYRKAGEIDNNVLFSFSSVPEARYSDYSSWHYLLSGRHTCKDDEHGFDIIDEYTPKNIENLVLKESWRESDWLRTATREPGSVQAVVPELELSTASRVTVRNQATRKKLIAMGFDESRVVVERMKVGYF